MPVCGTKPVKLYKPNVKKVIGEKKKQEAI